jgi:hypothetical protein
MTVTTWREQYKKGGYDGLLKACVDNFLGYLALGNDPEEIVEYLASEAANDSMNTETKRERLYDRLRADLKAHYEKNKEKIEKRATKLGAAIRATA